MSKRVEIIFFAVLAAAIALGIHLYVVFFTPASGHPQTRVVNIPRGMGFRVIADNLEKAGVVRDAQSFKFAARVLGAYKKVQAGEYEFKTTMSPVEVIDYLVKGKVKRHMVTIPEGYNIKEAAEAFHAAGLVDRDEFITRAADKGFAASLGVEGDTLEGYLFPDTYAVSKGTGADEIIRTMVGRFKSVYYPELEILARKKGMSMKKVVTLASIIEKETGTPQERGLVSAVFTNRLKKGIKLQSDPTVIYGVEGFNGNITKRHLLSKTPYNTYARYGLPPGPIANPGRASLEAALNPAEEEYLYFVSRNDGTHYFSKSLKEHNNAVNQYQKGVKAQRAARENTGR